MAQRRLPRSIAQPHKESGARRTPRIPWPAMSEPRDRSPIQPLTLSTKVAVRRLWRPLELKGLRSDEVCINPRDSISRMNDSAHERYEKVEMLIRPSWFRVRTRNMVGVLARFRLASPPL